MADSCRLDLSRQRLTVVNETYLREQGASQCGSWDAVTALSLANNQLSGTLNSLPNISRLRELNLYNNRMTGTLELLASATGLRTLHLGTNQFSGSLQALSGLNQLASVRLYVNNLNGTLDPLSQAVNLRNLYIGFNEITGTLDPIAGATQLRVLNAGENQITGTLNALQGMRDLDRLNLAQNDIAGTLQPLSDLPNITEVVMMGNMLSGEVPSFASTGLRKLMLGSNMLTGGLDALSSAPTLQVVNIHSNNLFQGEESISIALPNTRILNISNNAIRGHLDTMILPGEAALLDISSNDVLCRYPDRFQERTLLSLRDPCNHEQDLQLVAQVVVVFLLLGCILACGMWQLKSNWGKIKQGASFLMTQAIHWVDLIGDFFMLRRIFNYCYIPITACSVLNSPSVYLRVMQLNFLSSAEEAALGNLRDYRGVALAAPLGRMYPHLVTMNMNYLVDYCNRLEDCEFSEDDAECQNVHEINHSLVGLAIALATVYAIKEFFKAVVVLRFAWNGGEVPEQWRWLCQSSITCWALLVRGRARFESITFHVKTGRDALKEFFMEGMMETIPQMILNMYFALRITTQGLDRVELFFVCINVLYSLWLIFYSLGAILFAHGNSPVEELSMTNVVPRDDDRVRPAQPKAFLAFDGDTEEDLDKLEAGKEPDEANGPGVLVSSTGTAAYAELMKPAEKQTQPDQEAALPQEMVMPGTTNEGADRPTCGDSTAGDNVGPADGAPPVQKKVSDRAGVAVDPAL